MGAMSLGRIIELGAGCTLAMDAPRDGGRPRLWAGSYPWPGCGQVAGPGRRGRETGDSDRGREPPTSAPMIGEHRQLNTDFPWVGDLRNNQLKFKTA